MGNNKNRLVPLFAAHNLSEAYIAKGRLAAAGIETAVFDENTYAANPFYSLAMGGLRVMVNELDFERAYALLEQDFEHEIELLPEYLKEKEWVEARRWIEKDPELMDDIAIIREVVRIRYLDNSEIEALINEVKHAKRSKSSLFARCMRWFEK